MNCGPIKTHLERRIDILRRVFKSPFYWGEENAGTEMGQLYSMAKLSISSRSRSLIMIFNVIAMVYLWKLCSFLFKTTGVVGNNPTHSYTHASRMRGEGGSQTY